jgi:23S rRNA (guanosine2251-2'-O)-methyltransferase
MSRLIYGIRPVQEALRRRSVRLIWVSSRQQGKPQGALAELVTTAHAAGITSYESSPTQLDQLARGGSHQGVVALGGEFEYVGLDTLIDSAETPPLLLVVDGVTDPQNLGAMIRAAVVLGATGVVLTKDRCASITDAVVRVSSGATEHMRCARVTTLARALRQIKEHGLWVFGTVERHGLSPASVPLTEPCALVLGSENRGIRPLVAKVCDQLVTIPTPGPFAALNVATATAVVFYEAARQRQAG